ncbi:pyrroline-5-carboxylate reductase [Aerococcaceae bacterium DSM 111022]|nr:pyrroline-5-carboxylate reductase [Aerococcaceae bacterium DSM 111022]
MTKTIGFIGVGNMAKQLVKVVRASMPDVRILLNDQYLEGLDTFARAVSGEVADKETLIEASDLIFVGVKPFQIEAMFNEVALDLGDLSKSGKIWVSMAVSVSLEDLSQVIPEPAKWVRIMPNLPVGLGKGTIGYEFNGHLSEEDQAFFLAALEKSGVNVRIAEDLFDIYGAVAGSGPAFVFQFIEGLADAGVRRGLPRAQAIQIAAQMVEGAAAMVLDSGQHPGELKDMVTSPNGTTIAGVVKLEEKGLRSAIIEGVEASYQRSVELS